MILLAATGLLSGSLGIFALSSVSASYRHTDMVLTESSTTFQAWMADISKDASPAEVSKRVASRLLAMPIEKRRDLVVALMQRQFWLPLTPERQTPRAVQQIMRDGVILALHQAPMTGDLYLAAAWLEIRMQGFGTRAREMLKASHIFAPRELPLALERLALAPSIWSLLKPEERARLKADLETIHRMAPDRAAKIEAELAAAGVSF